MDSIVEPHFVKESEKRVADWDHKPKIEAKKSIGADAIKVHVLPIGPDAKFWEWASKGTPAHDIPVGARGFLAFQLGYQPHTTPGGQYGGSGRAMGDWIYTRKTIRHKGTRPRKFEKYIAQENKPWFSRTMENIWRRTIRAL